MLVENKEFLEQKAFNTNVDLLAELHTHKGTQHHPIGIVLISSNTSCRLCGGNLLVRSD